MKVLGINHVGLLVSNLETSIQFYATALKLTRKPRPNFGDRGAWFQLTQGQELHLIENQAIAATPELAPTHFALHIENLDLAIEHLSAAEIPYTDPKPRPDGAFQVFLRDPDNHLVELTGNLPE